MRVVLQDPSFLIPNSSLLVHGFLFKMIGFVFKMMKFAAGNEAPWSGDCINNGEFCIKSDG